MPPKGYGPAALSKVQETDRCQHVNGFRPLFETNDDNELVPSSQVVNS